MIHIKIQVIDKNQIYIHYSKIYFVLRGYDFLFLMSFVMLANHDKKRENKGHNSGTNAKMTVNNPKLDLVNMNAFISQALEGKPSKPKVCLFGRNSLPT